MNPTHPRVSRRMGIPGRGNSRIAPTVKPLPCTMNGTDHPSWRNGPDERVPPLCGLEDRVPPSDHAGSIRADGAVVKAKAFTKKRR